MSGSEVARLRRDIELRCEAAIRGLHEYAGVARHEVIARKMDEIGRCQEELEKLVGPNEAARIVVDAYIKEASGEWPRGEREAGEEPGPLERGGVKRWQK